MGQAQAFPGATDAGAFYVTAGAPPMSGMQPPVGPRPLAMGAAVMAHSLQQRPELNGKRGRVSGQQGQRVLVEFGAPIGEKALRPENLRRLMGMCHTCHRTDTPRLLESGDLQCRHCGGSFVEEIENIHAAADVNMMQHMHDGMPTAFAPFPFGFSGGPPGFPNLEELQQHLAELASQQQVQENGPPPASASAVASLTQKKVDADCAKELHDTSCVVCQDVFQEGEEMTRMPCGHAFHTPCLAPWLREHNSCPTCRHELPTDDAMYEAAKRRRADPTSEQ